VALRLLVRAIGVWQRRRGRMQGVHGRAGTVTFVQRFGSALNANLHLHVLVPDGTFDDDGVFHRLPNPTDSDVENLLVRLLPKLRRKLAPDDKDENRDDAILRHLGLPAEPLPIARAQAPPVTLELFGDP